MASTESAGRENHDPAVKTRTTDTIYDYLTPDEAGACRAYLAAYRSEYARLHDRQDGELGLLRYWSELAHRNALSRVHGAPVL